EAAKTFADDQGATLVARRAADALSEYRSDS
ncbi:MAG: hypothetical protein ACI9EZ_002021, partial [Halobacteriales archaeon]